jgi:flagellar biosynthetic protein FliR
VTEIDGIDELVAMLTLFLWPMIRISAFMITAPLFSMDVINIRIRLMVAVVLTFFIYDNQTIPTIDPLSADGLWQIATQVFIGACMGFLLQIVNAAIVVGGEAISNAMGLGFASMVDPNLGNVPLISQFMVILSTFIFLTLGGHLVVIQLLFQSFDSIPIGSLPPFADWLSIMFGWFPFIFLGAMNLALSMMVSLLLLNIALGVMTRSAPALNIIAVGFPAILLVGLLAFNVNITAMVYAIQRLWTQALATLQLFPGV